MNYTAREYRKMAHEECSKQINTLALIFFVYTLITSLFSSTSIKKNITDLIALTKGVLPTVDGASSATTSIGSILIFLFGSGVMFSYVIIAKKVHVGKEVKVKDLFVGFKDFGNALVLNLLRSIFIALWTLLLIIPGLIKAFAYSMAEYILIDNPGMGANDAIKKSQELMKGHKADLFCLLFSYIGWYILCALTLGILSFWVAPRVNQAKYLFYLNITGKLNTVEAEVVSE